MLRTHPVLDLCSLVWFAILTAVSVAAAQSGSPATLTLDLTKPPPIEEQRIGLPGGSGGGVGGGSLPRGYALPMALHLSELTPQMITHGRGFRMEVLLKNTGDSVFLMPASQNMVSVLKQGNKARRTVQFFLSLEDVKRGRNVSFVVGVACGSHTVPASFLRVAPGQTVRVLLAGQLASFGDEDTLSEWAKSGVKEVRARAEVSEWKYEDKRYFIQSISERLISPNSVELTLESN